MSLIHPITIGAVELYPIGSIIEAYGPPDTGEWMLCDGQIISQSTYSELYSIMDEPHPIMQDWTPVPLGFTSNPKGLYQVAYGASKYVAGGEGGTMAYSSNGVNWTQVTLPTYIRDFAWIAYGNGIFVSATNYYSPLNEYVTSPDGINWTERTFPVALECSAIVFDGTYFNIIADDDGTTMYSSDGINWTIRTSLTDSVWDCLVYTSQGDLIASNGSLLAISDDNMNTWTYKDMFGTPADYMIYDSDNALVIAIGADFYGFCPDTDLNDWQFFTFPEKELQTNAFYGFKKAGNYYIGMSSRPQNIFSEDLINWTTFPWYYYGEGNDVFYISSSDTYIMTYPYGQDYDAFIYTYTGIKGYDDSTYFRLPQAHDIMDADHQQTEFRKYIRVK